MKRWFLLFFMYLLTIGGSFMYTNLLLGTVDIEIPKDVLDSHLNRLYEKWYKKNRLIHVTSTKKDYPHLKISEDKASCKLYFFDDDNNEFRFILDGHFIKETQMVKLTSISPSEYFEIDPEDYKAIRQQLLKFSVLGKGKGIFLSLNGYPMCFREGKVKSSKQLLEELFTEIPEAQQEKIKLSYDWLRFTLSNTD